MLFRHPFRPLAALAMLLSAGAALAGPTKVDPESFKTTDSGLKYAVLKAGKGDGAKTDQLVFVHYTGWLADGKQFDSSRDRQPFDVMLGRMLVIPGFEEGLTGMKEGESRQLVIPPKLGYGEKGTPDGAIPANATLTFEVELVKLGDIFKKAEKPTKVEEASIKTTPSGLKYAVVTEGKGDAAKRGQKVKVHYTGWLQENGKKFDSSVDRGQPFEFPLGGGRVIKGWDEGVEGMKPGEKRQLIIPASLGYGDRGAGNVIPPGATLIFDVHLISAE